METSRQEPINFLVRSSGRGAAEVAAKQKRIRKNAVNLRIRSLRVVSEARRARRLHEHGVFARFRYNDLKEAARGCGRRGPYANSMVGRSGVELCRGCAAERDT